MVSLAHPLVRGGGGRSTDCPAGLHLRFPGSMALPFVLLTALDYIFYPTPIAAENGDPVVVDVEPRVLGSGLVYTSYRGVRTVFEAQRWKARIWFLVLPATVPWQPLLWLLGMAWFLRCLQWVLPIWTTQRPCVAPAFLLRYPGNWMVDDFSEGCDPDTQFSIEPMFQDAVVLFFVAEGATEPEEDTDSSVEVYSDLLGPGAVAGNLPPGVEVKARAPNGRPRVTMGRTCVFAYSRLRPTRTTPR